MHQRNNECCMRCAVFSIDPSAKANWTRRKRRAETAWFRSAGREMRLWSKNSAGGRNALRRVSCGLFPKKKSGQSKFQRSEAAVRTRNDLIVSTARIAVSMVLIVGGWVSRKVFKVFVRRKKERVGIYSYLGTAPQCFARCCCHSSLSQF